MSTSPLIFDHLIIGNIIGKKILDIGCGYGKWGFLSKKYKWTKENGYPYVVGIDIFEPHIKTLKKEDIYDKVLKATAIDLPFSDNEFDTIIASEIIEHLNKDDGLKLIKELNRVSKHCFIVTTPNFHCLRDGSDTIDGFNEYESHKYIYSFKEFKSLGFTQIIGVGRLQFLSWKIGVALSSLGLFFPKRSRYLIGFYFKDGKKRILFHN